MAFNTSTSPASMHSYHSTASERTDKPEAYFLAEIAMRRMLHRCNTAIRRNSQGSIIYAPGIALELERQLDEWYSYLPELIRFSTTGQDDPVVCPLTNFLCVQYHCYKISTYWPAVYQTMHDGQADERMLEHCRRLLSSYMRLVPRLLQAMDDCMVNRWTLFAR